MKRLLAIPVIMALVIFSAAPVWADPIPVPLGPSINGIPGLNLPSLPGIPGVPDTSCKPSPTPSKPGTGIPGIFDGNPGSTIYGPHWSTYDLGCAGPAANPGAVVDTYMGNQFYSLATNIIAFGNGVHHLVSPPTFLGSFDKLETNGTKTLYENFFVVFLPISVVILGLVIVFRSRHQNLPGVVMILGWAVLVLTLATLVYNSPLRIGRIADKTETSVVTTVNGAMGGNINNPNAVSDLEVKSVLRSAWLQGELGTSTGPEVDQWGQQLWDSQTLSWADMKGDISKITAAKQKQFADLATRIHNTDPATYDQLKGEAGGRWWAGGMALIGALLTVPFRLLADFILLASLVLVRIVVTLIPLLAPFALHDRLSGLIMGSLKIISAAVINAIIFSAASALNIFGVSQLLGSDSGVPQWVGVLLAGVLGLLLFFATKPFRQLTKLAVGYHPVHMAAHGAGRAVKGAAILGTEMAFFATTGKPGKLPGKKRGAYEAEKHEDPPELYGRPPGYTGPSELEERDMAPDLIDPEQQSYEQLSFWSDDELPKSSAEEVGRARERHLEVETPDPDLDRELIA